MSLWRDEKYLRLLGPTLDQFHDKGRHTFNFRCPLCGDSAKHKTKTRGYCFAKGDILMYKCHNCGVAIPFVAFLRSQNVDLYGQYMLEDVEEKRQKPAFPPASPKPTPQPTQTAPEAPAPSVPAAGMGLERLPASGQLQAVTDFARARKLPDPAIARLYGTVSAHTWLTALVGEEKAKKAIDGVPYLVQPLCLPDGTWYGAQLRTIETKEYYTFRWSNEPLKVFGLEAWTPTKTTYVTEGPIDALFVPNAISTCGSDLVSGIQILEDQGYIKHSARRVYVWDNEPRNKEITKHIRNAIKLRESVVIWPLGEREKDINDMVKAGKSDIAALLARRTFTGISAELEFAAWTK